MSSSRAAITISRPREEVERRWAEHQSKFSEAGDATVTFKDAPGDRGTEIHVEVDGPGKLGELTQKLTGTEPLAKAKDDLRRFKQLVETGEVSRSDATPEGELLERKLKQRPAQPLDDSELEKAGV
ncbi:MAG: hypothetical protein QOF65_61 [Thermoleophilaceae bacterium]|jgi:uncharacterized membrane protein|nr:hypothetical protein [Thermoleophilaceae bacterium]MEA2435505.1 hypothetical protein [Thermoleophilaceae bacterium]